MHKFEVTHNDGSKWHYHLTDEQHRTLEEAGWASTVLYNLLKIRAELVKEAKYIGRVAR